MIYAAEGPPGVVGTVLKIKLIVFGPLLFRRALCLFFGIINHGSIGIFLIP